MVGVKVRVWATAPAHCRSTWGGCYGWMGELRSSILGCGGPPRGNYAAGRFMPNLGVVGGGAEPHMCAQNDTQKPGASALGAHTVDISVNKPRRDDIVHELGDEIHQSYTFSVRVRQTNTAVFIAT